MSRRNRPAASLPPVDPTTASWSVGCRCVVSMLLLLHLAAIIIAPCTKPPPSSELAYRLSRWVEPYLSATYQFHGYRFFAPNPGPGHLVRCEVDARGGGEQIYDGMFPVREAHWPRLLYHRFFMVSERLWSEATMLPPPPAGFENRQQQEDYERYLATERLELATFASSVAKFQQHLHQGGTVRVYAQEHVIPPPQAVASGLRLDAPELYRERLLGELSTDGQWTHSETDHVPGNFSVP